MFTDENLPLQKLELSHRPTKRLKFSHPRGPLSLASSPEPLSERRAPKRPANFPVPKPVKKRCLSSPLLSSAESRLNSLDDYYRVQIGNPFFFVLLNNEALLIHNFFFCFPLLLF